MHPHPLRIFQVRPKSQALRAADGLPVGLGGAEGPGELACPGPHPSAEPLQGAFPRSLSPAQAPHASSVLSSFASPATLPPESPGAPRAPVLPCSGHASLLPAGSLSFSSSTFSKSPQVQFQSLLLLLISFNSRSNPVRNVLLLLCNRWGNKLRIVESLSQRHTAGRFMAEPTRAAEPRACPT